MFALLFMLNRPISFCICKWPSVVNGAHLFCLGTEAKC
uniref:Uncharacterized protein n=1 Tax=Rhizophora mucronata TaxID=61149 RepID=A0A2P2PJ80_RHIMU